MKKYFKISVFLFAAIVFVACEFEETEFGFDGSIKGMVTDNSGTPVYADINSNTLVVKLLGEGDEQAIEIRVAGDGSYQNTKMFPKKHEVWLEGPVVESTPVTVDFGIQAEQVLDFSVTPLVSPVISNGSGNGTSITVNYSISLNSGNTVSKMEVYASTVKYPTKAIGSRDKVYSTKTVTLSELSGTAVIEGLESGVHYYVRIGAQADGAATMNYSNQLEVEL